MSVSYDIFTEAFLAKVSEYTFLKLEDYDRMKTVDGYMKRACAEFKHICQYDLVVGNDDVREFMCDIPDAEIEEIVDIITEGMLVQWLKPYMYKQENYELILNTTDYSSYSPAELLYRVTSAYKECKSDFTNMMREYSYNHGDLSDLHL